MLFRKQLGHHPNFSNKVIHTESGWMSSGGFLEYLQWIREVVQNEKIYLLVDQYPTHFTEDAKVAAQKMNIILIPIPKGGTDRYQPLDRRIFGIMKSMGAAMWSEIYDQNPGIKLDKRLGARLALECWEKISKNNILAAWGFEHDETSSDAQESGDDPDFIPAIRPTGESKIRQ